MKSYNNENESKQIYNILDIPSFKSKQPFELKQNISKKIYIISKEDYDKGIKYLNNTSTNNRNRQGNTKKNRFNLNFLFESEKIKDNLNRSREGLSLVTEEFLKELDIDENKYNNAFVYYFEDDQKIFLLFQSNDILEITKKEKEEKGEDNLDEIEIIKNMILIYANDNNLIKNLNHLLTMNMI